MDATVSVVIATYNRASLLDECLEHLGRQSFGAGDGIIVVDNGSTDNTADVIASHQKRIAVPFVALREPRPGKSNAIAAALAVATGSILAFTDDDVNVDARWLDAIRAAMCDDESGQVALVGGPVEPRWERQAPAWLKLGRGYGRMAAPLALLDYGEEPVDLGPRTLLGANMAVRRDVLQTLGGLRPHLGKLRGTLLSGEDHELCQRVQRAGFRARYCPQAIVRHFVPDDRLRVGYFLKWFFWSGITNAQLDTDDHPHPERRAVPPYFIRMFAAGTLGAIAAALTWKRHRAIERATQAAFAAGYAARKLGGI